MDLSREQGLSRCPRPLLCSYLVPPLPTQNRPSGRFVWPKDYFELIFATWGHIWNILGLPKGPTGQPGCPRFNIVPLIWGSHPILDTTTYWLWVTHWPTVVSQCIVECIFVDPLFPRINCLVFRECLIALFLNPESWSTSHDSWFKCQSTKKQYNTRMTHFTEIVC